MKASVDVGSFNLYDPTLVPSGGIVGTASCEAGATFRYKNTWTMASRAASTFDSIFCVNGTLWTTPNEPFVLDYVSLRFTTNLTGVGTSGPALATLGVFLELDDNSGPHSLIQKTGIGFTGTYNITTTKSLFSTVVDPGFLLNSYSTGISDQTGAVGGADTGNNPVFHAYSSAWFGKPMWVAFTSEPAAWTLSGTVILTICGRILA
jgi:hypothetical protein